MPIISCNFVDVKNKKIYRVVLEVAEVQPQPGTLARVVSVRELTPEMAPEELQFSQEYRAAAEALHQAYLADHKEVCPE